MAKRLTDKQKKKIVADYVELANGYNIKKAVVEPSSTSFISTLEKRNFSIQKANDDFVTGRNEVVPAMTYQEWYEWKANNSKDRFEEFKLFPAEKKLVYQGYEEGLLLDWDGSVIMNLVGTRSSIQVPNNFAEKAKGKTFSHTHPDGRTLSPADVLMMDKYHLLEVRAITDKGTYRAINTGAWKQHFDSVKELNAFYLTLDSNLIQEYKTKVDKGLISEKQADDEVQEKLMLLLSKEVGFMYEFIPK